jgi:predicted transcriptional regulator
MKKFSVRLSEEAAAQLADLAKREGSSKAAIVRQALVRSLEVDAERTEGVSSSQPADARRSARAHRTRLENAE